MNGLYPIFLKLEGRSCLVVGGGEVAKRKVISLLDGGALVCVVSHSFDRDLVKLSEKSSKLILKEKEFDEGDLEDKFLVIAATSDEGANKEVYRKASKKGLLVNVVDRPKLSNFYVPSSFARGDLKIAVSTGGKSPSFAKKIRMELEKEFGQGYATVLECLFKVRQELKKKYPNDVGRRGKVLDKIVNSSLIERSNDLSKEEILSEMMKWI